MRGLFIRPRARLDLLQIWLYLAQSNVDVAIKVGDELDAAILDLLAMPGKGYRRRDVKSAKLRFWVVHSYVISYRYDDAVVTVVRVLHGRRNVRGLVRKQF
jgi:toxin ParE1/3/4